MLIGYTRAFKLFFSSLEVLVTYAKVEYTETLIVGFLFLPVASYHLGPNTAPITHFSDGHSTSPT